MTLKLCLNTKLYRFHKSVSGPGGSNQNYPAGYALVSQTTTPLPTLGLHYYVTPYHFCSKTEPMKLIIIAGLKTFFLAANGISGGIHPLKLWQDNYTAHFSDFTVHMPPSKNTPY